MQVVNTKSIARNGGWELRLQIDNVILISGVGDPNPNTNELLCKGAWGKIGAVYKFMGDVFVTGEQWSQQEAQDEIERLNNLLFQGVDEWFIVEVDDGFKTNVYRIIVPSGSTITHRRTTTLT